MTVEFIADPQRIKAMTRGQVMSYVRDLLLDSADNVRKLEDSTIRLGLRTHWHRDAQGDHDASAAAALVIEKVIVRGKDQVQRGVKIDPLIELIVDVLRSCLIQEITNRQPAPVAPRVDGGDVAG